MPVKIYMAALFSAVSACAATASYVDTAPPNPPRAAASVALLFGNGPLNCTYREIGYVEGESRLSSPADAINAMRREAGLRGADAIVLIDHQDPGGHHGEGGHNFAGVAIAFVGSPCTQSILRNGRAPSPTL